MRVFARNSMLFALPILLAACADEPFPTSDTAIRLTEEQTRSFCYSAKTTTRERLTEMARTSCATEEVQVWDHDTFMNDCPISAMNRVTFLCVR